MKDIENLRVVATDAPPSVPARLVEDFTPSLVETGAHHLCPGCGEPIAIRSVMEAIEELDRLVGPQTVMASNTAT